MLPRQATVAQGSVSGAGDFCPRTPGIGHLAQGINHLHSHHHHGRYLDHGGLRAHGDSTQLS